MDKIASVLHRAVSTSKDMVVTLMKPKLIKFIEHIRHTMMITDESIKFRNECKWSEEDKFVR